MKSAPVAPPGGPLPRGPVLDWSSWRKVDAPPAHSLEELPHTAVTTSGRAAIYHALMQLTLPTQRTVLVPTYHCPTMIAPIYMADLLPAYYGLRADGLPDLAAIDAATAARSGAIIVPHYFGIARSMIDVRRWCDERGIALIEDCAHCYFGDAGERPVGAWGDYSIASLSKFFPVSEAGLLASASRPIAPLGLARASSGAQVKGWVDVLELASRHGRFSGIAGVLALLFRLKNACLPRGTADLPPPPGPDRDMIASCDMGRIGQTPLWSSTWLKRVLPRGRIRLQRQRNFAGYAQRLAGCDGARPLFTPKVAPVAPYVFPLWVDDADDADAIYAAMRERRLPVFRWDRIWPGTPVLDADVGRLWSRQVLQLVCHQDLGDGDVAHTCDAIAELLRERAEVPSRQIERVA